MIIFLVGYMGSGKSYWGKRWAQKYNLEFCDLDMIIEESTSTSIPEIFSTQGEAYFRKQEALFLRKISKPNLIVACGGGTACFWENMRWMNQQGITIYLSASVGYLQKNIEQDPQARPLIQSAGEELNRFIGKQVSERNYFYRQANFTLNAENLQDDSLDSIIRNKNKKYA